MNFCTATAPEWATEIRHPDLDSTEYWRVLSIVTAADSRSEVSVGLVQSGPEAEPQVVVGGVRFSLLEGRDCLVALQQALEIAGTAEEPPRPEALPREAARGEQFEESDAGRVGPRPHH